LKNVMKNIQRVICIVLCMCIVFPCFGVSAEDSVTVAYLGNAKLSTRRYVSYSDYVNDYIGTRVNKKINSVIGKPVDFGAEDFMNSLIDDIIPSSPDIVFIELDVSKNYVISNEEVSKRLEAMIKTLSKLEKAPSVYFIYTTEETLRDNQEPFDKIAKHYEINVTNTYKYFKNKYLSNAMLTNDFLTAGLIPSEKAHKKIGQLIENELKVVDDLFKTYIDKKEAIYDAVYEKVEIEVEKPEVSADGTILYVSVNDGRIGAKGTIDDPFKTVEEARNYIREVKKQQGDNFGGATVYLREGLYQIDESLKLTDIDSGTDTGRIVYSGYKDELVRLTNAKLLEPSDFKIVTDRDTIKRMHPDGIGNIYEYDLGKNGIDTGVFFKRANNKTEILNKAIGEYISYGNGLIVNEKYEDRAKYPNGGYDIIAGKFGNDNNQLVHSIKDPSRWETADSAWAIVLTSYGYMTENNEVASFDTENKIIKLKTNFSYPIAEGWFWSLQNLIEELDIPGEWYVDKNTKKLYYYPRTELGNSEILFMNTSEPVVSMNNVKNITFKNMTFEGSAYSGVGAIECNSVIVDGCVLRNMGYAGALFDHKGKKEPGGNAVINSHIYDIGFSGVVFQNGDQKELTASGDYVENCHIERFSQIYQNDSGGVFTNGTVGVRISNCNIHNDNSAAIYMGGNDDLIEYNELYNIVKDTDDYGVLYGAAQGFIRQGVEVRYNYLHDNYQDLGRGINIIYGFYSDAARNNSAKVHNNVFLNQQGAIYFSNNKGQHAEENLILDSIQRSIQLSKAHYSTALLDSWKKNYENMLADDDVILSQYRGVGKESQYVSAGGSTMFYRGYLMEPAFTEETKNTYYLKYPMLERFLIDGHPDIGGDCVMKNNAILGGDVWMDLPDEIADNYTVEGNLLDGNSVEGDSRYERIDKGMEIAKNAIPEFDVWDVREAGMYSDPKPVEAFNLIAPINGASEVPVDNLCLKWDYASGADEYEVVVATDKEFKNIVFEGKSRNNYVKISGLKSGGKVYYWKVRANSWSEQFTGSPWNMDGVRSFTTVRFVDPDKRALGKLLQSAKELLEQITEGTAPGEYKEGTKAALEEAVNVATQVYENPRADQYAVEDAYDVFLEAYIVAHSNVKFGELDITEAFVGADKITFPTDEEVSGFKSLTFEDGGLQVEEKIMLYTKQMSGAHQIFHGKLKLTFETGTTQFMTIGIGETNLRSYLPWAGANYIFLVSPTVIELQKFHPNGRIYEAVPNTYMPSGTEHDVEFAAIPSNKSLGARLILRIDGEIVYDYTDTSSPILNPGYMAMHNTSDAVKVEIYPPEKQSYPSLVELLNDPDSELYK